MRIHPQRLLAGRAVALAAVLSALVGLETPAHAAAPTRVGWWNTASAGTVTAPAPTTPKGGMHVAFTPGQVLAFGAVLYPIPAGSSGRELTLTLRATQGTAQLLACPTKTTRWQAGDDQPAGSAPGYDCGSHHWAGAVSADGSSVSFTLTSVSSGALSLAIVPDPSAAQPFSVDVDKPTAASLTTTSAAASGPAAATAAPTASGPTTAAAAAPANGRPLGVPQPPAPPGGQIAAPNAGAAPQVAPSAPPVSGSAATPTITAGAGKSGGSSTAGAVFGVLALLAALLFWGLGRGLLGGRILPLSVPIETSSGADAR